MFVFVQGKGSGGVAWARGLSLEVAPASSTDNSVDGSSSSNCLKMLMSRIHCRSEYPAIGGTGTIDGVAGFLTSLFVITDEYTGLMTLSVY